MKIYTFYKEDFANVQWYDIISQTEDLPEFTDLLDKDNEISEEYEHLFAPAINYDLAHDSLRINRLDVVLIFMQEYSMCNNKMTDDITNAIFEHNEYSFQLAGDGDGLGFILDFFTDNTFEECLDMESQQFWFEDYKID